MNFHHKDECLLFHKSSLISLFSKWANPSLFCLFLVFSYKHYNFPTNQCNKMSCPSSKWHKDSNPRPLKHESSPITTIPGLPLLPYFMVSLVSAKKVFLSRSQILTRVNVDYLTAQVEAGAQMVQVFESHAEFLGPDMFKEFCLPYLKEIAHGVKQKLTCKGIEPVPMVSCTLLLILSS